MGNKRFLPGILILVLVCGMMFIGCGDSDGGDKDPKGTFTLTDIPAEYNGKYALFNATLNGRSPSHGDLVIVGLNYNKSSEKTSFIHISNGRVGIPLWISKQGESSITRYSGNDTFVGFVYIFDSESPSIYAEPVGAIWYGSVTFKNGNAIKSYNDTKL